MKKKRKNTERSSEPHPSTPATFDPERLAQQLLAVQEQNRKTTRLDGWFLVQEIRMNELLALRQAGKRLPREREQAHLFAAVCRELPLAIRPNEVFAGTQDDGFARTYALINPDFKVETFAGYCDPMSVYGDIRPAPELGLTKRRINTVRDFWAAADYAQALAKVYHDTGLETREVVYFVEQVTGHTIADFRPALTRGLEPMLAQAERRAARTAGRRKAFYEATHTALTGALILADRYARLAAETAAQTTDPRRREDLVRIAAACERVPRQGARNLFEAIQSFILLWMAMVLEQAPNPYAFSVGNLDRILDPFHTPDPNGRDVAVQLVRHLLALFNVGDRNWAISQNVMVGGRDEHGRDLTNPMTTVILDAFRQSNYPQPALSVKLHKGTPDTVYAALDPFFSTPGALTPSLFNDDVLFDVLRAKGIAEEDLPDYAIAGCQEPLIMGKESGNTTNSWLNLAKVLELTLHDGRSAISGQRIGLGYAELGLSRENPLGEPAAVTSAFWQQLAHFLPRMANAANRCTEALALLPVPFLSCFMGGLESGRDMRDTEAQGTRYNASGCLIHGLSVVADSLHALAFVSAKDARLAAQLPNALRHDFQGYARLQDTCIAAAKYGNDEAAVDQIARSLMEGVCTRISALRNPWANPFAPDWSTPSTHLLYGYWVGATPDGRRAHRMLGFGIDPTAGNATRGLPPRIMSTHCAPYRRFTGGYASHIGLDRRALETAGARVIDALRACVLDPLFGYGAGGEPGGYYVYLNIDTAEHLREILERPEALCPGGIYILRIHGTFVNFLDLSPAIQEDIIERLDPASTRI